jgi:rubredoxin
MADMNDAWICRKCGVPLVTQKVVFEYLGHSFSHDVPKCPQCGKVMISGELAEGKVVEVETMLEDK